ncbi:unnamed protein product, partial [marine sediment metagenome]
MVKVCGDCGSILDLYKKGAFIFSMDLKKCRRTVAYLCKRCDKMVLHDHVDWHETPIEKIDLKPRYNVSLS